MHASDLAIGCRSKRGGIGMSKSMLAVLDVGSIKDLLIYYSAEPDHYLTASVKDSRELGFIYVYSSDCVCLFDFSQTKSCHSNRSCVDQYYEGSRTRCHSLFWIGFWRESHIMYFDYAVRVWR